MLQGGVKNFSGGGAEVQMASPLVSLSEGVLWTLVRSGIDSSW